MFFDKPCKLSGEQIKENPINIEIAEEMAEGQYANLAIITHSRTKN